MPIKKGPKKPRTKTNFKVIDKQIKKVVKNELKKELELKHSVLDLVGAGGGNSLILTPSASTLPLYYDLQPAIVQNTGNDDHIGARVMLKSAKLRIKFIMSGASLTDGVDVPMNIYWFLLHNRESQASMAATDLNELLYGTGGTTTQFLSGSGYATTHRINNDYFRVAKTNYPNKPIKIGFSQYQQTSALYANNDYKMDHRMEIDYTSVCEKIMRFNNTSSGIVNHNWFLVFYVQKANLDTATASWDAPNVYISQDIAYTDA